MLKLAQVAFLDNSVHILAVVLEDRRQVLLDGDRRVEDGLRCHGNIILQIRSSCYSSIDCPATSALHLAMNSASGTEPWSPLPRVRTLTDSAASSLSPKTRM